MGCVEHGDIEKQHNQFEMKAEILEISLVRLTKEVPGEAPQGLGEKHWYVVVSPFLIAPFSQLHLL